MAHLINEQVEVPNGMAERLAAAMDRDEFVLYSQSIVSLANTKPDVPFQEVFIRFKEEDVNLLPPGDFFPILEEHNLLPQLDRWVVDRLSRWASAAFRIKPDWSIPISNINLSDATISDSSFGEYLHRYVDNSVLSDGALGFEVDWNAAVRFTKPLEQLLKEVSPFGCSLTLAEFDGSEAAFSAVQLFTPEFVKISAPSITGDQMWDINLRCQALGTQTIVQFVESAEQLERLRDMAIDFAQGLHLSPVQEI
jgi:EAL domain-containing protein (putative c-di-GMP-specific phosphodiesterase class I)